MLKSLHISNYALITELEVGFAPGFSVITGETGAGKSIIMGALSLILGQRADTRSIKEGEQKCVVEALFDISSYRLEPFFEDNGLDFDAENCLVRRELTAAGKSRAFVNDTPVPLTLLRELGNHLIDIHSQHENLLLSHEGYQLGIVDTVAKTTTELAAYREKHAAWKALKSELQQLEKQVEKQSLDADYMRFQYQQLEQAALREGEQEELEQEQETLAHAEEIKLGLQRAAHLLSGEEMALYLLNDATGAVRQVESYVTGGSEWTERLQTAYIELKDIADEIQSREERLEVDPQRLEQVENRLGELYDLCRRHKVADEGELIALRDELAAKLQRMDSSDEELAALRQRIAAAEDGLAEAAQRLTEKRKAVTASVEDYLVGQLVRLGMPNVRFKVDVQPAAAYTDMGRDEVQFLFSANKNKSLLPVVQIASGGEIARVMLAVKSLIAHGAGLPTIVFDEIDTGVSGEIAHRMGEIMESMGRDMQVVAITHLPQIAARGREHYKVYKDESGDQAQTFICRLDPADRVVELAKMLSGEQVTDAALSQAEELLQGSAK